MSADKSSGRVSVPLGPVSGGLAQLIAAFHLPGQIRKALPPPVLEGMYELRKRVRRKLFSRGLPRDGIFEQPIHQKLASASISIIVPIHDAPEVTKRCLGSLELYAREAEIILVDDASKDPITLGIIQRFSSRNGWKVISNSEACGHSAACEAGACLASRPYLCLLNSDTVVTPWCWRPIVEVFETCAAVAAAGPSTSESRNAQTLDAASHCRHYWNDSQICAFAERLAATAPQPPIVELPWICGCAFFIRRELWEGLKGFDRNLPDYGNEVELCARISGMGYRIVWVRNSYIHHLGRQSYADTIGDREIQSRMLATYKYVQRKHATRSSHTPEEGG
ncbi:MAG: glycosyltransferase [Candidatus Sulfotelmatobacter sp.]